MHSTPALPIFRRILKNVSPRRQRFFYQVFLFGITFIAYVTYHVNKRPFGDVKSVLSPDCNLSTVNNNKTKCQPWKPFIGNKNDNAILGLLDFTFMLVYSISIFVSGYLAEQTDLRIFLTCGMLMTGLSSMFFAMGYYLNIHAISFFFVAQVIAAITQSTGLPAITEAIGEWLPLGKTGLFFGIWSWSSPVGNILGNSISGVLLVYGWGAPFLMSAAIICACAILVYFFLFTDPAEVNISIENTDDAVTNKAVASPTTTEQNTKFQQVRPGINVKEALLIPGVVDFSLCVFFVKLVHYTFFFWLPFIINTLLPINASESAYLTSYYDIGSCIGGAITGHIYDVTDKPALVSSVMLVSSVPLIILLFSGSAEVALFKLYIFLIGCLIGGPFILMTSSLAKRLGSKYYEIGANTRTIAVLTAVFDGFGSLGASFGPLLTGLIKSWRRVSFFLCACALIAVFSLTRRCYSEIMEIILSARKRKESMYCGELVGGETDELIKNEDK